MTVEKIIPEEHALARTLDKVNREISMAASGSKRHTRLKSEKSAVTNKIKRRRKAMPDR
jgi:hypothetical protein